MADAAFFCDSVDFANRIGWVQGRWLVIFLTANLLWKEYNARHETTNFY
jgi:hypothetical protein